MNARLLLAVVFLAYLFSSDAQVTKAKFGKVSNSELTDNTYEPDPSANAVVLYDKGYFNSTHFHFTRHIRIKILRKEGTDWANWTLRTPSKSMIHGVVFNKEGNEIIETRLTRESIHEEEIIKGYIFYKFFFENVKEGSIIDLEFSFPGLPFEFRFQQTIPVAYCELLIEPSMYVNFDKRFFGFYPLTEIGLNHWVVKNAPAFVSEPYMNDYSNYVTKIQFEISSITFPNYRYYRFFSENWEQVNDILIDYSNFLGIQSSSFFLNEKAEEIKKMDTTLYGKIFEANNYIKENIIWNGVNSLIATDQYISNFKKLHTGNSAEINLALLFLLKKADIPASAVVLSTRDNGLLAPFYPSLDNLNYVIVMVKDGENLILLDATEKHGVPGILPERCLNGKGLVVKEQGVEWVDLLNGKTSREANLIQLSKNESDVWSAEVVTTRSDYSYLEWAHKYDEFNDEIKYLNYLSDEKTSFDIEEYELSKHQPEKLLVTERLKVNLEEYVDDLGNEVFIKPLFTLSDMQNPFRNDERKYPVDFAYPAEKSIAMLFAIPEGYALKSLPKSITSSIPDKSADVTILFSQSGNNIQIHFKLRIKKALFTEAEYLDLRGFYSVIIDKLGESIHLVKL